MYVFYLQTNMIKYLQLWTTFENEIIVIKIGDSKFSSFTNISLLMDNSWLSIKEKKLLLDKGESVIGIKIVQPASSIYLNVIYVNVGWDRTNPRMVFLKYYA